MPAWLGQVIPFAPEGLLAQSGPSQTTAFVDRLARTPLSVILIFAAVWTVVRFVVFPVLKNTRPHQRGLLYGVAKFINEAGDALVYASILVFFLVRPFAIQTFTIPTGSMIDTLNIGSNIVANKWVYRTRDPQFQEIVVFSPPQEGRLGDSEVDYIKRCVGVPGDIIEIRDDKLYRNGKPVEEPYETRTIGRDMKVIPKDSWPEDSLPDFKLVKDGDRYVPVQKWGTMVNNGQMTAEAFQASSAADEERLWSLPAAPIPPGHYLMMGDNRNGSYDGRAWGLVPRENVVGKCEFVWWPFSQMGKPQ